MRHFRLLVEAVTESQPGILITGKKKSRALGPASSTGRYHNLKRHKRFVERGKPDIADLQDWMAALWGIADMRFMQHCCGALSQFEM
jgi:hypothetical protein